MTKEEKLSHFCPKRPAIQNDPHDGQRTPRICCKKLLEKDRRTSLLALGVIPMEDRWHLRGICRWLQAQTFKSYREPTHFLMYVFFLMFCSMQFSIQHTDLIMGGSSSEPHGVKCLRHWANVPSNHGPRQRPLPLLRGGPRWHGPCSLWSPWPPMGKTGGPASLPRGSCTSGPHNETSPPCSSHVASCQTAQSEQIHFYWAAIVAK